MTAQDNSIVEFIHSMLDEEFGISTDELEPDSPLFTSGLLDSVDVLGVVSAIEEKYDIRVNPMDVSIERLNTISLMSEFISGRLGDSH